MSYELHVYTNNRLEANTMPEVLLNRHQHQRTISSTPRIDQPASSTLPASPASSCPSRQGRKMSLYSCRLLGALYAVACMALSSQSDRKLQNSASDSWPSAEHTNGLSSANNWSKCLTF